MFSNFITRPKWCMPWELNPITPAYETGCSSFALTYVKSIKLNGLIKTNIRQMKCISCQSELKGRQQKFCSPKCKSHISNCTHQAYASQKQRGFVAKKKTVLEMGGKCTICGYCKNLSSLEFHHKDPSIKEFMLDIRSFANRPKASQKEAKKCQLVCCNCHRELHNPSMSNWVNLELNSGSFVKEVAQ